MASKSECVSMPMTLSIKENTDEEPLITPSNNTEEKSNTIPPLKIYSDVGNVNVINPSAKDLIKSFFI